MAERTGLTALQRGNKFDIIPNLSQLANGLPSRSSSDCGPPDISWLLTSLPGPSEVWHYRAVSATASKNSLQSLEPGSCSVLEGREVTSGMISEKRSGCFGGAFPVRFLPLPCIIDMLPTRDLRSCDRIAKPIHSSFFSYLRLGLDVWTSPGVVPNCSDLRPR